MLPLVIKTITPESPQRRAAWLACSALCAVTVAELLVTLVSLHLGLLAHLTLIVLLIIYAAAGSQRTLTELSLGLILVPMIRVLSVGLPLERLPQIAWYPLVAAPLFVSMALVMRQTGLSTRAVGVRWGHLPQQLAIGAGGVALGVVEYNLLRPQGLLTSQDLPQLVFIVAVLFIFTGVFEEVLFRGVLQQLALRAFQLPGLILISLLFTAMHTGYRSPVDLLFVCLVGCLFSYVVLRGGSLLGVSIAHGLANVVLFVATPAVAGSPASRTLVGIAWVGAALALGALLRLVLAPPHEHSAVEGDRSRSPERHR